MRRRTTTYLARTLGAWALLIPGALAFQPVFGDARGAIPGLVGITLGTVIVLVGGWLRATPLTWVIAGILGYYLVGGPIAAPETLNGAAPTLNTVIRLTHLTYQGFGDLVTVAAPAGDVPGPQAVPLLVGLICSITMVGIVRHTRAVVWPILIPVLWLGFAIAFGINTSPHALWLGLGLGSGILAWGIAHRMTAMGVANATFLMSRPAGMNRRTWQLLSAGLVIALGCGVAASVEAVVADRINRQVLRDIVVPPLDLSGYPSPLVKYRFYSLNQAEEVLFTVSGVPANARLRLAVMDHWNGEVFSVTEDTGRFLRVGRELPWQPQGTLTSSTITANAYDDVWVPSFGQPSYIEFHGANAASQGRGLYVNEASHQALTTARFSSGSGVVIDAEPLTQPTSSTSSGEAASLNDQAEVERIPEVLVQLAATWTADTTSPYEALSEIAEQLRENGYYSNGAEENSRAGHSAERLAYMFNQDQWVGDDEQYAAAMSLMASSRGIPTRVVLGFYPDSDPGQTWQVTGADAHVWVEANIEGVGWVSFDPTPDREPDLENPDPKPKPKPRVDPPPAPPEHLEPDPVTAEEEPVDLDERKDQDQGPHPVLTAVAVAAGILAVLALPLLLILAVKAVRLRRRRSSPDPTAQVVGAWDEVVDRARDLGFVPRPELTRREAASRVESTHDGVAITPLAGVVDRYVFSHEQPDEAARGAIWSHAIALKRSLLSTRPWYARPVAIFSWRSLRRERTHPRPSARTHHRRGRGSKDRRST